ncbi:MAG: indole-3-glycerol phosphate synthase TrpC [bacterium]
MPHSKTMAHNAQRDFTGDVFERILAHKREEVRAAKTKTPSHRLERTVHEMPPAHDFAAALRSGNDVAIIAEMKKASPSSGVLREDFDAGKIATGYARNGAAALSVLTDENFFQGSFANLQSARRACVLPLLCKDFIVDAYQILMARAHGADAILLIATALEGGALAQLQREAHALGMHALIEIHDEKELDLALAQGAKIIGVNNRDLRTFQISLQTSLRLLPMIPPTAVRVAESGIQQRVEVEHLRDAGVDAILVGTQLMRQPDPGAALQPLKGVSRLCCP